MVTLPNKSQKLMVVSLTLICCVILPVCAVSDTHIINVPPVDLIQETQALDIGCRFLSETTGIDESVFMRARDPWCYYSSENNFIVNDTSVAAPYGYWFIQLKNWPYFAELWIDAESGIVFYWNLRDESQEHVIIWYMNTYPKPEDVDRTAAQETAVSWVRSVYTPDDQVADGTSKMGISPCYTQLVGPDGAAQDVWEITIAFRKERQYGEDGIEYGKKECTSTVCVAAKDGVIVDGSLTVTRLDEIDGVPNYTVTRRVTYAEFAGDKEK
jgi:hypothetical protein